MINFFKNSLFLTALVGIMFCSSCTKNDPALPDNLVAFDSDQLGTSAAEAQTTITITSLRAVSNASTLSVSLAPSTNLVYGTQFTTDPAAVSNELSITVPANATTASFLVKKTAGALFDGTEKIVFTIQTATNGLVLGEKKVVTLSFAEIVAASGTIDITGGGVFYPNNVFIDFSGNRQTAVARTTWDLAFSTTDDFRVLLNSSNGMMAYKLSGKTDLNSVTAADVTNADLANRLSIGAVFAAANSNPLPLWLQGAINWVDNANGDLTKNVIGSVSAIESENLVFIVNRGEGPGNPTIALGWKKIRIIRNGDNYTIQHADISATTFSSTTVTKDANYRFSYFSFESGTVSVAPSDKKWDIEWTGFTNTANVGFLIPYYFQDIIVQSPKVQAVAVLTSTISYDNFVEANLSSITLLSPQLTIGSTWRSGGGPPGTPPPAVRSDRFYVVKDPDGNYYKLRFTALATNGERGKPQLEFRLVKKAS